MFCTSYITPGSNDSSLRLYVCIPCSKILPEKLIVAQLVKKCTVFTKVRRDPVEVVLQLGGGGRGG